MLAESILSSPVYHNDVLIIEDHPLYQDTLILLLRESVSDSNVHVASSAEQGLRLAAKLPKLDLILLDINLPGISGMEAVATFYRAYPTTIIIVLSASEDRRDVTATFRAGARAFISKHVSRKLIADTVRRAFTGELLKSEWIRSSHSGIFTHQPNLPLNARQMEILFLLARGCTNREIAEQVGLAEVTIKQNITIIFRVLGVENRAQALLAIHRFGLATE